jgi:hypothetical protein
MQTELTPALIEEVAIAMMRGAPEYLVPRLLGISLTTWQGWLQRGSKEVKQVINGAAVQDGDALPLELQMVMRRASAKTELRRLQQIQRAARSNWQAAAWLLERSDPVRWGQRSADVKKTLVALMDALEKAEKKGINLPTGGKIRERIAAEGLGQTGSSTGAW